MELNKVIKDLKDMRKSGFIDCNIQCFLDQLNKVTESVVVDQFIADWYEKYKDNFEYSLWEWMRYEYNIEKNKKFYLWLNNSSNNPVETLIKMKLFGYQVRKEKKYIIKVKNVQKSSEALKFDKVVGKWYFGFNQESSATCLYHTKEDIVNAGFGWMFSSPGFEVEEVEE